MLLPASSWAQTTSPSPSDHDQETIAQLVEQIKQLQQKDHDLLERIKILEAKQPQAAPVTEADAPPPHHPQPAEQSPPPPPPVATPHDWHDVHGIQFRGFENSTTRFSISASRNWEPMGLSPVRRGTSTLATLVYSSLQDLLPRPACFLKLSSKNTTRRSMT